MYACAVIWRLKSEKAGFVACSGLSFSVRYPPFVSRPCPTMMPRHFLTCSGCLPSIGYVGEIKARDEEEWGGEWESTIHTTCEKCFCARVVFVLQWSMDMLCRCRERARERLCVCVYVCVEIVRRVVMDTCFLTRRTRRE